MKTSKQKIHTNPTIAQQDPKIKDYDMLGFGVEGRPIHVVCAPMEDYLAVITAYIPEAGEWSDDFRRRITP